MRFGQYMPGTRGKPVCALTHRKPPRDRMRCLILKNLRSGVVAGVGEPHDIATDPEQTTSSLSLASR